MCQIDLTQQYSCTGYSQCQRLHAHITPTSLGIKPGFVAGVASHDADERAKQTAAENATQNLADVYVQKSIAETLSGEQAVYLLTFCVQSVYACSLHYESSRLCAFSVQQHSSQSAQTCAAPPR